VVSLHGPFLRAKLGTPPSLSPLPACPCIHLPALGWMQVFLTRTSFTRLRIQMLAVHVLARGFLMRKQIVAKHKSLRRLQVGT
jgi:hypothetical protein